MKFNTRQICCSVVQTVWGGSPKHFDGKSGSFDVIHEGVRPLTTDHRDRWLRVIRGGGCRMGILQLVDVRGEHTPRCIKKDSRRRSLIQKCVAAASSGKDDRTRCCR